MHLCITGFLPNNNEDDLLKFQLYIDPYYNDDIVSFLGHRSLDAMSEGLWRLSREQIIGVSEITGNKIPIDLDILIGVED